VTVIRSLTYHLLFLPWTILLSALYLPFLAFASRRFMQRCATFWLESGFFLQRHILGLSFLIKGAENLPPGPVIIAAKHQSAWDTMIFHHLLADPAYILKKELLFLPFIGWYLRKTGQVPIDRQAGVKALKLMIEASRRAIKDQRQIVIFPEGHRQAPGASGTYHSGVAMLYAALDAPLVPVALNSGLFWSRNAFLRHSGVITLEILPALPRNLDRKSVMTALQQQIETATQALEQGALRRFPHLTSLRSSEPSRACPVDKSVE